MSCSGCGRRGSASSSGAPKHPKSALQEWAAANNRRPPVYELIGRSGPHHAPSFIVEVSIKGVGEARAEGADQAGGRDRGGRGAAGARST